MCTLTLAWQVFEDAPVAVAANRDESYGRPSEPPAERDSGVIAPRDAEAGGTWMGVTRDGLFVGVTNRWVEGLAGERSRGLLVDDCLRAGSAEEAARLVGDSCAEYEYDGFNLVVADAEAAVLLEWDGHLSVTQLEPGVHVVVNVGADGRFFDPPGRAGIGPEQATNARELRDHLAPRSGESADAWLDRAGEALGDHEFGVCVHGDVSDSGTDTDGTSDESDGGYGTVSSSLIRVGTGEGDGSGGDDGPVDLRYDHAEGPPCETAFEPVALDG